MCEADTYSHLNIKGQIKILIQYYLKFKFFKHEIPTKSPRLHGDNHFIGKCRTDESISIVIWTFVTYLYCRCRNLNYWTVEYKYRGKPLVASKYCQTVNCRTIAVSDCEIRL